jgi:hypothetical protein
MNNRRIALGLGTGAGALLGAALLSGLTSPIAAADDYAILPDPAVGATNPMTDTLPAFGGLGTDTISTETFANYDTGTDGTSTPLLALGNEAGTLTDVTNTYSNPLFTDTSTDITAATGSLAGNLGDETDTLLFDPSSGEDFGISLVSVPGVGTDAAPVVTEDLITPVGNFPISDLLGGSDLSSLFSGGDLSSLFSGGDLSSLFSGGDLLGGLDPLSLLTSFGL